VKWNAPVEVRAGALLRRRDHCEGRVPTASLLIPDYKTGRKSRAELKSDVVENNENKVF
jgi:hypothetical protein